LVVALLYGVTLDSLEFETAARKYHLDVDLLSSSLQVTELIVAECEVLEICRGDRDLILVVIDIDSLGPADLLLEWAGIVFRHITRLGCA